MLRLNGLRNFCGLGDSESLHTLDLSLNDFKRGCEDTSTCCLTSLKRLVFGVPQTDGRSCAIPGSSISATNTNSLLLFRYFFVERFYKSEEVCLANPDSLELAGLRFRLCFSATRRKFVCEKLNDVLIPNHRLIITTFVVLNGFEILETDQEVLFLSQLVDGDFRTLIRKDCGSSALTLGLVNYPTV